MSMELVHTEKDSRGIEYRLYIAPDDIPVRGNALASGDAAEDRAEEDAILARLDAGETWAWAQTKCEASFGGMVGFDYLGACSYRDTEDFTQPGGYWDDMKAEARREMELTMERAGKALEAWKATEGR